MIGFIPRLSALLIGAFAFWLWWFAKNRSVKKKFIPTEKYFKQAWRLLHVVLFFTIIIGGVVFLLSTFLGSQEKHTKFIIIVGFLLTILVILLQDIISKRILLPELRRDIYR